MFRTSNIQKINQSIGGYIKFNTTNCDERVIYNIPVVHVMLLLLSLSIEGSLFTFLFLLLCPSRRPLIHVECLPVVRFQPFLLPLVRACSHTSPDCPSMFWASAIQSFTFICPKGSCFSLVKCFHRPASPQELTFQLPLAPQHTTDNNDKRQGWGWQKREG